MTEPTLETTPATVPAQPVSNPPFKKGFPVAVVLVAIVVLIGLANLSNLVSGKARTAPKSALATQPATISQQQVKSYQAMQATETQRDAADRQQQAQTQQGPAAYQVNDIPGPEADAAAPMTAAQRLAIYGNSPNAPQRTSNASQGHAEAKQRGLAREKERQDALNSDTVAIDFATPNGTTAKTAVLGENQQTTAHAAGEDIAGPSVSTAPALQPVSEQRASKTDPMAPYAFDDYQGQL
ncbi:MAG: hypothetical protein ACRYFU_01935, partial [Janthinobacterium lividum]